MLRVGESIGAITVARREAGPFTDKQIALLQTFADQAVIAIENVRLFKETKEALERQEATGEILNVIASSPTDIQPVFEAIADRAMRLLAAWSSSVWRYEDDLIRLVAPRGGLPGSSEIFMEQRQPGDPAHDSPASQTVLTRTVFHSTDVEADPSWGPRFRAEARMRGFRSIVAVPMLSGSGAAGVVAVTRADVGGFTPAEIALLQAFADQAVIAIENVRLFTELQEKNQALTQAHAQVTESLDQQTATAEILRVISQSPTDIQPVFDAIASTAVRLCESNYGVVHRFDGTNIGLPVAMCNVTDEQMALYRRIFPLAASLDNALGESALTRRTVQIEDTQAERRYTLDTGAVRVAREVFGYRTVLMVPMVHRDQALGIIAIWRREQRPFSPGQIALVQTFADQAVIAIENVRLFTELQASNRELTTALDTQTATSDILRVISRSQTDVQPVFDAIVASAVRLLGAYSGTLTRVVGRSDRARRASRAPTPQATPP